MLFVTCNLFESRCNFIKNSETLVSFTYQIVGWWKFIGARFRWIAFIKPGVALREPNIVSVPVTVQCLSTHILYAHPHPQPTHPYTYTHTHTHTHKHTTNTFTYTGAHALTLVIDLQLSSCQQVVQLTGYSEELLSVAQSTHTHTHTHTDTHTLTHKHYMIVSSG